MMKRRRLDEEEVRSQMCVGRHLTTTRSVKGKPIMETKTSNIALPTLRCRVQQDEAMLRLSFVDPFGKAKKVPGAPRFKLSVDVVSQQVIPALRLAFPVDDKMRQGGVFRQLPEALLGVMLGPPSKASASKRALSGVTVDSWRERIHRGNSCKVQRYGSVP